MASLASACLAGLVLFLGFASTPVSLAQTASKPSGGEAAKNRQSSIVNRQSHDSGFPDPWAIRKAAGIQRIDLIHLSHTDFGFTDHPAVCRELQRRYIDVALDLVQNTAGRNEAGKFYWTLETTAPFRDWWQSASPDRREKFVQAVRAGQLEVTALPLNNSPFLDREEWRQMLHWLPDETWQLVRPVAAVQDDVNGFPRAGAMQLLDRGVRYLWMGLNADSGGAPFKRPSAFWWRMPDGRKILVYLCLSYPMGYYFFEPKEWRQGPLPAAADTRYRPPQRGDFLRSDPESVRAAHRYCLQKIQQLEKQGYPYPTLALSMTNQWRIDNDPPFAPLADFVAAWNRIGLKPELRLTTVSSAMKSLEQEVGDQIPECSGEWTDWWANGAASQPREVSAARRAKRILAAALSLLWGPAGQEARRTAAGLYEELCLFDEHTWGSWRSVSEPDSLDTYGQFTEKSSLAYRALALAEWFLSRRVRNKLLEGPEGLYLANPFGADASGWVDLPVTCFRDKYQTVLELPLKAQWPILFDNGWRSYTRPLQPEELSPENQSATFPDNVPGQQARFWNPDLSPRSIRRYQLSVNPVTGSSAASKTTLAVEVDAGGWPVSAIWEGMKRPLFLPSTGDFLSAQVRGFAPRWIIKDILEGKKAAAEQLRREALTETRAVAEGEVRRSENAYSVVYTQAFRHPRLRWGRRQLELWKDTPRARLTIRINRLSSYDPEAFLILFPLPCEGILPIASNGGVPFTPFVDQLPGTCKDYFATDGIVHYQTPAGHWIWTSRDAPLVTFGTAPLLARRTETPSDTHRLAAVIYNNFWYTNFLGDSPGLMEFQFDLVWKERLDESTDYLDLMHALCSDPVVLIHSGPKEDPVLVRHLYEF